MGKSAKAKQRRIKTYRHVPEVCITQCINLVRVMLWHAVRALQTTLYTPLYDASSGLHVWMTLSLVNSSLEVLLLNVANSADSVVCA